MSLYNDQFESFERLLTRIADALEKGNELAAQAMAQRGSMDPAIKTMVDAAMQMANRPSGFPVMVLMRDSENGMCPKTGESCTEDCGIGNPCKAGGRVPS